MIILDTHAWVWWQANPELLSEKARAAIEYSPEAGICPMSLFEVAWLAKRGRIKLKEDVGLWLRIALGDRKIELVPISAEIAARAAGLDERYPGDPADRLIAATAVQHHASLVTKDQRLRSVEELHTIW